MKKCKVSLVIILILVLSLVINGCSAGNKETENNTEVSTEAVTETEELTEVRNETEPADTEQTESTDHAYEVLYRMSVGEYYQILLQEPDIKDLKLEGNTITYSYNGEKCSYSEEEISPDVIQITVTEGDITDIMVYDYINNEVTLNGEKIGITEGSGEDDFYHYTAGMEDPVWGENISAEEIQVTIELAGVDEQPVFATILREAGELPQRFLARNSVTKEALLYEDGKPILVIPIYYYNQKTGTYDTEIWDEEKGEPVSLSLKYEELEKTCVINMPDKAFKYITTINDPDELGLTELMADMYQYDVNTKEITGKRDMRPGYNAGAVSGTSEDDPDFTAEGRVIIIPDNMYEFEPDPEKPMTITGTCVTESVYGDYVIYDIQIISEE